MDIDVINLKKVDSTTVPWFNKLEWMMVYNFLYSETPQRAKAAEIIKMWKMRHPRLPAGIEGTFILLNVMDKPSQNIEEYDLKVLYSAAIMRFLNVCVTHDTVQGRFSMNANRAKIPQWITDIRHEVAHGVNLPQLNLMKEACDFGYNWLYSQYWFPVSQILCDYEFEVNDVVDEDEENSSYNRDELIFLLSILECIILCQHSKFNVQTIQDIPDPECRQKLLEDLKNFRSLSNITEDTELSALTKLVIYAFHGYLSMANTNTKQHIIDQLLNGIGFLCDEDLQMQLFESKSLEILSWNYVSLWLELLQVFCKCAMLNYFLKSLFDKISDHNESKDRKRMASLWLIEIAKALKKVQLCRIVYEKNFNDMDDNIKTNPQECAKYVIEKTESIHPTLKHILTFDPFIEIPSIVGSFKQFSYILREPNEYIKLCLPFILELNTPKLDSNLTTQLHQLVEKFVNNVEITNEGKSDENVYSVEDLKQLMGDKMPKFEELGGYDSENMDSDDDTSIIENTTVKNDSINEDIDENNRWKMAAEHLQFQNCPLGLLPWQDKTSNPFQTLLENL